MSNNKFEPSRKFFTISVYAIVTTAICAILIKCIWNWEATMKAFSGLFSSLSPFLLGFFIAYIMSGMAIGIENRFLKDFLKIKKPSIRKGLSLVISYLLVFAIIIGSLVFIIPALVSNITDMAERAAEIYNSALSYINTLSEHYPNTTVEYIEQAVKDNLPHLLNNFKEWASELAPTVAGTSMSIVKWIFNLFIAIIVSIYMLLDKNILSRNVQRIVYSVFNKNRADYVWETIRHANEIFNGYVIGKTIDSLIIGVLCLILMSIFGIGGSYIFIISIIVGLTNMIPYFGPFIGAVPSILLILLLVSPNQAFAFTILIIVLQQFDGNILGPFILGDKTGLRPIWIIFAISIGGWLGGVVGMFLGVPFVAVISSITDDLVESRLKEKEIDLPQIQTGKSFKDKQASSKSNRTGIFFTKMYKSKNKK